MGLKTYLYQTETETGRGKKRYNRRPRRELRTYKIRVNHLRPIAKSPFDYSVCDF